LIYSIAAASIIAKVTRDSIMNQFHDLYPEYNFQQHKGYPTLAHRTLLHSAGPSPIHRLTYAPVKAVALTKHKYNIVIPSDLFEDKKKKKGKKGSEIDQPPLADEGGEVDEIVAHKEMRESGGDERGRGSKRKRVK
jgi:hypothetical protein